MLILYNLFRLIVSLFSEGPTHFPSDRSLSIAQGNKLRHPIDRELSSELKHPPFDKRGLNFVYCRNFSVTHEQRLE